MPTYKLRDLATIQRQAARANDFEPASPWIERGRVWLELTPLTAWERVNALTVYSGATYAAICRPTPYRIDAGDRLLLAGEVYEIQGAIETDGYLKLMLTHDPKQAEG